MRQVARRAWVCYCLVGLVRGSPWAIGCKVGQALRAGAAFVWNVGRVLGPRSPMRSNRAGHRGLRPLPLEVARVSLAMTKCARPHTASKPRTHT